MYVLIVLFLKNLNFLFDFHAVSLATAFFLSQFRSCIVWQLLMIDLV